MLSIYSKLYHAQYAYKYHYRFSNNSAVAFSLVFISCTPFSLVQKNKSSKKKMHFWTDKNEEEIIRVDDALTVS